MVVIPPVWSSVWWCVPSESLYTMAVPPFPIKNFPLFDLIHMNSSCTNNFLYHQDPGVF